MSEFTVEVQDCELVDRFVDQMDSSKQRIFSWKIPIGKRRVRVVDPLLIEVTRRDGMTYLTGYPMVFGFSFIFSSVLMIVCLLAVYVIGVSPIVLTVGLLFLSLSVVSNPRWFVLAIWIRLRLMGYRGSYRTVHMEAIV